MSALYIHIPFCKTRCNYCDFYKSTSLDKADAYIEALGKEMEYRRDFLDSSPIRTIYFGGGTPSVYPPRVLQRIIDKAATIWNLKDISEITVEVNPDDITEELIDELVATSINRISIGVQSFIDRDLKMMGRRHTAQQAIDTIMLMKAKGVDNISADLIFGIPGMTLKEWESNVLQMLIMGVQHISAYSLSINDGTVFGKMVDKGELIPEEDSSYEEQFVLAHQLLSDGGYKHYEIANYSLGNNHISIHNSSYWNGEIYLGLGPSAHSYDRNHRIYSASDLNGYIAAAGTDKIYTTETLTEADKYNEFIMTGLRTTLGVRRDVMTDKFGFKGLLFFEYTAEKMLENGLLVQENNTYRIPPEKMMISNSIISDLFYVD